MSAGGVARRRRRRRSGGPFTVNVPPGGGTWSIAPGAGTLSALTLTLNVAPTSNVVRLRALIDNTGLFYTVVVGIGDTTGTSGTTRSIVESAVFSIQNMDGGPFTVSGSVVHTANNGTVTTYNLLPQEI
jgi:hypothetical protein